MIVMVEVPLEVFDRFKELMTTESLELMQRVAEYYKFGSSYKVSAGNCISRYRYHKNNATRTVEVGIVIY